MTPQHRPPRHPRTLEQAFGPYHRGSRWTFAARRRAVLLSRIADVMMATMIGIALAVMLAHWWAA